MKRVLLFCLIAVMVTVPFLATAQEPGSGGPIIEGNFGGSSTMGTFNPLRCDNTTCSRIWQLMFPTVIGASGDTQYYAKIGEEGVTGALATDWTVSEDGTTYTFTLRNDAVWSDGTPITAKDVKFAFEAIKSGVAETALYTGTVDWSEANPNGIKEVNVIDDYTVEMVFGSAACTALGLAGFPVIPSHVFGYEGQEDFDYSVLVENEFDLNPTVTFGNFKWGAFTPGESIGVIADTEFIDGAPLVAGYIYKDVPDQTVLVEQFIAGETNLIDGPAVGRRADLRNDANVQVFSFPGNAWDYVGLNLADPTNPQPGLDENGNLIDQGYHPIFGDVRVRRAMQLGIDVASMVEGAVFGEGQQMASAMIPGSWATDPNLAPVPFDPEAARALLDEAGWVASGDPLVDGGDGQRVCEGCLYAEAGTPFEFTLQTNQGNSRREAAVVIIQDQLATLGIKVNVEPMDFETLLDVMDSETFDAYLLGWRNGFPDDPDQTQLFGSASDDPANGGSNNMSYHNPEVAELMAQAASVPGCAQEDRAAIYHQIQKIIQDDQPYLFLYAIDGMYAARTDVEGFDPRANIIFNNVEKWFIPSAN